MINQNEVNLVSVAVVIKKYLRLISVITLSAMLAGAILFMVTPKKYMAKTEFLVRNPMYGDRTIIYNNDSRLTDYFAGEDEMNKLIVLYGSDIVRKPIIRKMELASAYKKDTTDPDEVISLERKFNSSLTITQTEYGHMTLTYKDTDPKRAIAVTNEYVRVLDYTFSEYYREMRRAMYQTIREKIHEQDSAINALTDTLAAIRDRYGLYASKYNLTFGNVNMNRDKKVGRGIEEISNIEMLKDALVSDRVAQVTLINHYQTGLDRNQLSMLKVITPAKIPNPPGFMKGILMALICGAGGFFFTTILVLFSEYVTKNRSVN